MQAFRSATSYSVHDTLFKKTTSVSLKLSCRKQQYHSSRNHTDKIKFQVTLVISPGQQTPIILQKMTYHYHQWLVMPGY